MSFQRKVLKSFKSLHRTSQKVFKGDNFALNAAREKINQEFKRNKNIKNPETCQELLKFSYEVENELRTTVIQAVKTEPGKFAVRITEDTLKLDNVPFKNCSS